ncbi:MAG: protease complex subunit PrcB family protein [Bacillota bacterium]
MKIMFVIAAVLAAGLAGCGGGTASDNGATILSLGPQSAVKEQGSRDIHDQAAFKDMWDKTFADQSHPPAMPQIDWTKQAVVAYFLGEMKHGGYTMRVARAEPAKDTPNVYDVDFLVIEPGTNCPRTTNDITHPYIIAVVPSGSASISLDLQKRTTPPCG